MNPNETKEHDQEEEDEEYKPSEKQVWLENRIQKSYEKKIGLPWMFWAPEHIETWRDAKNYLFWMPTKRDMLKVLEIAKVVHGEEKTPIRILDIGGSGGFVDKLLVDLAREQGLTLETVVLDPAKSVLDEASAYYKTHGEDRIQFVTGTLPEHPEIEEQKFDVVFNSWLYGDVGDDIRKIKATARVYVADRMGATGIEEDYDPREGYKEFGSWPVIDHASIEDAGFNWAHTTCQIAVQLSDEALTESGALIQKHLESLDDTQTELTAQYPWEKSLEQARDQLIARGPRLIPGLARTKKDAKWELDVSRAHVQGAIESRDAVWWKFSRGTKWSF